MAESRLEVKLYQAILSGRNSFLNTNAVFLLTFFDLLYSLRGAYSNQKGAQDQFEMTPWMLNPFHPPDKIYWMICPTHQVYM